HERPRGSLRRRWRLLAALGAAALLVGSLLLRISASRERAPEARPGSMRFVPVTGEADSAKPSFSPDGETLAFANEGVSAAASGIAVKEIGGAGQRQLTRGHWDRSPVWSPDGQTIAFTRRESQEFRLYVVPVHGGAERPVEVPGL